MDIRSQRSAEELVARAVDQVLDTDPLTGVRQVEGLVNATIPYLRAARRAAIYRAKNSGLTWGQLSEQLNRREIVLRRVVARHCADTGDPWPARAGTVKSRPRVRFDFSSSG